MRLVFADTSFWIPLLDPTDQHFSRAREAVAKVKDTRVLTSDFVRLEVLNYFSAFRPELRNEAALWAQQLLLDISVRVVPISRELFERALSLYASRMDKQWSITDCSSFVLMQGHGITEALTSDHHFEQAGFTILMQ